MLMQFFAQKVCRTLYKGQGMNIYQERLMDHYHNPRNYGQLENPDFATQEYNPSCGDLIAMQGLIQENNLTSICFTGKGCIISQATASLLCQEYTGKNIQNILTLTALDVQTLLGISLGPLRLKCALLPLLALQEGIASSLKKSHNKE